MELFQPRDPHGRRTSALYPEDFGGVETEATLPSCGAPTDQARRSRRRPPLQSEKVALERCACAMGILLRDFRFWRAMSCEPWAIAKGRKLAAKCSELIHFRTSNMYPAPRTV